MGSFTTIWVAIIASNDRVIDELEEIWKESVMA
jgi:hypothetical protein